MIRNFLTFDMSVTVYRLDWSLLIVSVKRLASLYMLPVSIWRHIKVLPYLCACVWSRVHLLAFVKF